MKSIATSRGSSIFSGVTLNVDESFESQLGFYKKKAIRFLDSKSPPPLQYGSIITSKNDLLTLFYKHKYT